MPYVEALALQRERRERLLAGEVDAAVLLLLECEPIITLGRSARHEHLVASAAELAAAGIAVLSTDRGGEVTYHGPGQLLVFPVLPVRGGVVAFLQSMADGLAALANELGVPGARWRRDPAGVWLGEAKLAACGLHLRRGVVAHGFAFNVATPPERWRLIVPCGLAAPITSIALERARRGLPPPPSIEAIAARAVAPILSRLGVATFAPRSLAELP